MIQLLAVPAVVVLRSNCAGKWSTTPEIVERDRHVDLSKLVIRIDTQAVLVALQLLAAPAVAVLKSKCSDGLPHTPKIVARGGIWPL